jgi:hypothetical protein
MHVIIKMKKIIYYTEHNFKSERKFDFDLSIPMPL